MRGKKGFAVFLAGLMMVLTAGCSGSTSWVSASGETEEEIKSTAANGLEAVRQMGKIRIGISADYAPFAFEFSEEEGGLPYAGSDIELGKYIAEQLEVDAEFCEMEFDDCLAAVADGSVDLVLLGMLPKENRDAVVDYTDVYYQPGKQVVLVKAAQEKNLSKLEDFEEKTVAAQYGSLQAQLLAEQFPGSYPELTKNMQEGVLLLRLGTADGVILDEAMAKGVIQEFDELAVSKVELSCPTSGIVGGVAKGETELLQKINEIIQKMSEENLYLKWLDTANEQARSIQQPIP